MSDPSLPTVAAVAGAPAVHCLGDSALVLEFGTTIDPVISARVLSVWHALAAAPLPGVLDCAPAYGTITVFYDPCTWDPGALAEQLLSMAALAAPAAVTARRVEIPVCYAPEFAPDMDLVCAHTNLAAEDIVRRHSMAEYRVYFIGFTPGFPYLGGLDPALATPRRATPRVAVPAGSVAIGGVQTGVYPQAAPGGWQIIGRTPLALFDARREPACLLAAGDTVRFVPIDRARYAEQAVQS